MISKLGLTPDEFDRIMALPPKRYEDYPSYARTAHFRFLRGAYYKYKQWRGLP